MDFYNFYYHFPGTGNWRLCQGKAWTDWKGTVWGKRRSIGCVLGVKIGENRWLFLTYDTGKNLNFSFISRIVILQLMKTVPLDTIHKRPNCVVIDCFTLFITMRYRVTPKNLAIHSFLVSGQFYEVILNAFAFISNVCL